ncbi:MAG: DNA-deoxyinosine glycosylase [Gammaproteobacteria bacterium]|nr:DNA-deoxyinosine glycosylase [Gammaproteobacteria bacterium]
MTSIYGFPPVSSPDAELLILGSMPGKASLRANQYYAYPRNAFWPLMESIYRVDRCLVYEDRCRQLLKHKVAVWDVLKKCIRKSSLDSDIVGTSVIVNDFEGFYATHRHIRNVYFNGAMAEKSYRQYVLPSLPDHMTGIPLVRLPSTSPAHAALSFEQKLAKWEQIRDA